MYKNVPLAQVINELKVNYQINFSYVNDYIPLDKKITIRIKNRPLTQALDQLFRNAAISYQIVGNQVVLKKSTKGESDLVAPRLTQTIRGVVLDKQLHTALPGANVILVNSDPFRGAATDMEGNFRLEKVPVGRQELKISYTGYKDLIVSNILVNSGKEVVLTVALEEHMLQSQEIVITAQKDKSRAINELVVTSVASLRPDDINRFAGSMQDPSRMAGNYAGVENGDGQVNHIVVRGNSPRGLLWRLEGVDIVNPNHFTFVGNTGGGFSILNNNILANSDFLTGAFPAEYGNKISSVMDIQFRKGNNEKHEHTVQLGINGLEYVTEGPLLSKNGSSYLASLRMFDFTPIQKLGIDLGVSGNPRFGDGALKIYLPTHKTGIFSIWAFGGQSSINAIESKRDSIYWSHPGYATDETSGSGMYAAGISHTFLFSPRTFGKLVLASSGGRYGEDLKDVAEKKVIRVYSAYKGNEGHHIAGYTLTHKASTRHLLKAGVNYRVLFFNQTGSFLDRDSVMVNFINHYGGTRLVQSFLHWQFRVGERLDINSGLYGQVFTLNQTKALEPRFSLNYQLTKNQRLGFAYGLHSQAHPLQYYFTQFLNRHTGNYDLRNLNLDMTRSQHWVGSYTNHFNGKLHFKAEAYYQSLYHVPVSLQKGNETFSMLNTGGDNSLWLVDSLTNKGTGKNYGLEFTAERYFNRDYYFLATASLFESKYKGMDGVERHTEFSVGYIFNLLGGKEFKLDEGKRKMISVDGKANFQGGRRFIPVDTEATLQRRQLVIDPSRAYESRQKSQLRFDLRITYNINLPKATHNVYVAVDNIFNARNVISQYWDEKTESVQKIYQIGLLPYLGYRVHF